MTTYCTVQDVRNALIDPSAPTPTNTGADLSDAAIQDAINEAQACVDAYVGGPYDPTVETIPAVIKYWTRDIGAYYTTLTWRKSADITATDPVYLRYDTALNQLQSIAEGKLDIPTPLQAGEQATVENQYDPSLIHAWEFDLYGKSYGGQRGWPLGYYQGWLWWPTDLPQEY